jgi:hypothetical protein
MRDFKVGTQLIVAKQVKVYFGNSSSSSYAVLKEGEVVCITSINAKTITVAFNITFSNWAPAGSFNMQTIMLGRIKLQDLAEGKLLNTMSSNMQERDLIREIVLSLKKVSKKG